MSSIKMPDFLNRMSNFSNSIDSNNNSIPPNEFVQHMSKQNPTLFSEKLKTFSAKLDSATSQSTIKSNQLGEPEQQEKIDVLDDYSSKFEVPIFSFDKVVENLMIDMLCSIKTENMLLRTKISHSLKHLGCSNYEEYPFISPPSTILMSEVGGGKMYAFEMASRKVAGQLDLNFLKDPAEFSPISEKDFVYASMEFANPQSKSEFQPKSQTLDLPNIQKQDNQQNKQKINIEKAEDFIAKSLNNISKAQVGVFLLDSVHNASTKVQNMIYALTQDKKTLYGRVFENLYVGMTTTLIANKPKQDYEEIPGWLRNDAQSYIISNVSNKLINKKTSKSKF